MTVLYKSDLPLEQETPDTTNNPFERNYQRVYKLKYLVPLFPNWNENWAKFWYRESYLTVLSFSLFFYLLTIFFIYLAISDRNHITSFLLVALGWLLSGLILPAGIYRLVAFFLKRQKIVM